MQDVILVPIDFSDCSIDVVRLGSRFARGLGGRLVLLYVVELPPGVSADLQVSASSPAGGHMKAAALMESEARALMARYVSVPELEGLEVSTRIEHGLVAETILRVASELDASQIVIGTHGRRGFARMVAGSVAEAVVRASLQPVTVVRTQHKPHCQATSCAWCRSGELTTYARLQAEVDG